VRTQFAQDSGRYNLTHMFSVHALSLRGTLYSFLSKVVLSFNQTRVPANRTCLPTYLYFFHFFKDQYNRLIQKIRSEHSCLTVLTSMLSSSALIPTLSYYRFAITAFHYYHHPDQRNAVGGSGWVRTIDPRLIKTVL
jgi:hypothetical protein